jgi:cytoskeletal protein CcmA (bactofilin family)
MKKNNFLRLAVFILLLVFLGLTAVTRGVQAAQFTQNGQVEGEINDDLFVNATDVTVNGSIHGNLFASGTNVTLNGVVDGDAFLAGAKIIIGKDAIIRGNLILAGVNLNVSGNVSGSIFAGGQQILLTTTASLDGNLFFGGYDLETQAQSLIARNVYFGGAQAVFGGIIQKDLHAAASGVEISGEIGQDAHLDVAAPGENAQFLNIFSAFLPNISTPIDSGIKIDPSAKIGGSLIYTSTTEQTSAIQGQITNPVIYQTPMPSETQKRNTEISPVIVSSTSGILAWLWTFLRRLISMLVLGALALWLLPKMTGAIKKQMIARPFPSFAYGLLVAVVGFFSILIAPVLFILLGLLLNFLSLGGLSFSWFGVIGIALAFLFIGFLWLVFTGGALAAAYGLGYFLVNKMSSNAHGKEYLGMLLGVVLYILLLSTPWYINWIFALAAGALGLGAMWLAFRRQRRERKMA